MGDRSYQLSFSREEKIDRSFFIDLLEKHRLSALFYWKLKDDARWDGIPLPVREAWEERYHAALAQTTIRYDLLKKILSSLREGGLDIILLKGSHLAESYYPHPVLRPFDDVDLLIAKGKWNIAQAVLEKARLKFISETVTARKYAYLDGKGPPRLFLEVHSDLQTPQRRNPSFDVKIEDFWEASHPVKLYGASVRVLDPALNLIYLSAHLAHHGFSRLIWFYDLYLVVERSGEEIDWELLLRQAKSYRSETQVFYPLFWAKKLFGSAIPEKFLSALSPPVHKRFFIRFLVNQKSILSGELKRSPSPPLFQRFLMNDSWPLAFRRYFFKIPAKG